MIILACLILIIDSDWYNETLVQTVFQLPETGVKQTHWCLNPYYLGIVKYNDIKYFNILKP